MAKLSKSGYSRRRCRFEALEDRNLLANVPAGFTESIVASNLTSPITFDIEDSGRIWLAFQDGRIQVIENDQMAPGIAIQLDADGSGERGLQGLELDPDFENNGYIYVYYTAASPESHNRVSRLTVDPLTENTIVPGSELVLLDLPGFSTLPQNQDPIWHMGGAVHFLPDGTLVVQIGDHLNNTLVQDNNAPMGKILRMNVDGTPATDNPYYDPADNNPPGGNDWNGNAPGDVDWIDYVWSSGLRNPYSGDVDPATSRYFINDVGQGSWEEINEATTAGLNFGWPTTEGYFDTGTYPNLTNPFYAYSHSEGCAITGGAFNSAAVSQFPSEYQGQYFFSEFCGGTIQVVDPDNSNDVSDFITAAAYPMNIEFAADGSMYYIARGAGAGGAPGIGTGQVLKVEYAAAIPPQIIQQPGDVLASVGYDVTFNVSAAGSSPLEYQWQRDNGGGFMDIPDATSSELVVPNVSLSDDDAQFRVVVSNGYGMETSAAAALDVTADTPPLAEIALPLEGTTYRAGDIIDFSGMATDAEDGELDAASLTWQIDFHHDTHLHPFLPPTSGISGGQFEVPVNSETASNVWFRIHLIAKDSAGLETEVIRDIYPETSVFTPVSNVEGSSIAVDGQPKETPINITGVINVNRSLEAPAQVPYGEGTALFSQWLDGETDQLRTIPTPELNTAYVALYRDFSDVGVYLSDLTPSNNDATPNGPPNGWGPIEYDTSNGEDVGGDGNTITLNGVEYEKGLGVHAYSEVAYDLSGQYTRFISDIGVDDETGNGGSVVFRVFADGNEIYTSGVLTGASDTETVNVDITGVENLLLVVDNAGNGNGLDHADWADARVVSGSVEEAGLLPFYAADVNLDGFLDLNDALAFAAGWGTDGSSLPLQERVELGDLDFDGDTDIDDWSVLNARWLKQNNAPISLDALLNPLAGDYNCNGIVTQADYQLWKSSFGSSSSLAADGNGDGQVGLADYTTWRNNLGAGSSDSVFLDNLVLFVDPTTGEGWLKNDTDSQLDLVGYTIASHGASLLPEDGDWNSFEDQGLTGWEEAGVSPTALNELNALDSLTMAPGQIFSLGMLFDTNDPLEGLSLSFGESSSFEQTPGVAVFSELLGELNPAPVSALVVASEQSTGDAGMLSNVAADSDAGTTSPEMLAGEAEVSLSGMNGAGVLAPILGGERTGGYQNGERHQAGIESEGLASSDRHWFQSLQLLLNSPQVDSHFQAAAMSSLQLDAVDQAFEQLDNFGSAELADGFFDRLTLQIL
ncbi:NPCBM/NEW2 domain-containing protein [Aeoliella sp. ICT_H6.2]|uniref:NPCBM/NEW2 domain-containing protein n=1 Tax=Aeoliella straminimaris TaxID=2954799 RepID=A0A9X2FGF3_9BACT|nr:NPCBM/NEW2 domain-containing protein [Aeoliella straminimaris]MCO6045949.1 NPCBM/NEW2 domain-containing protein [Aeoliella straminimaris]